MADEALNASAPRTLPTRKRSAAQPSQVVRVFQRGSFIADTFVNSRIAPDCYAGGADWRGWASVSRVSISLWGRLGACTRSCFTLRAALLATPSFVCRCIGLACMVHTARLMRGLESCHQHKRLLAHSDTRHCKGYLCARERVLALNETSHVHFVHMRFLKITTRHRTYTLCTGVS
jgi:hypothetical protein